MAERGWIPAEREPKEKGNYRVKVVRNAVGLPEFAETTALWTRDEGWEFTDGLIAPERSRVTAWKPLEEESS